LAVLVAGFVIDKLLPLIFTALTGLAF